MDGPFYCDTRLPHNTGPQSAVTLTTANQPVIASASLPLLGNFFNYVGKTLYIRVMGQCTSGATPGNFAYNWFWGNNTAANGLNCNGGISFGWTANGVNSTLSIETWVRCRQIGTAGIVLNAGTVFLSGTAIFQCPFSGMAQTTGFDTTLNNYMSLQIFRTGSTVETVQIHEVLFEAMN